MLAEFFDGLERSSFEGGEEALFEDGFLFDFLQGFVFDGSFTSFAVGVRDGGFEALQQFVEFLGEGCGVGGIAVVVGLTVDIVAFGFDLLVACHKVFEVAARDIDVGSGVLGHEF